VAEVVAGAVVADVVVLAAVPIGHQPAVAGAATPMASATAIEGRRIEAITEDPKH
jgi:hypothetical protein